MSERRTERYKKDAIFTLNELLASIEEKSFLTIGEIANALEKDRNFVSAFVNACVAFGLCDVKRSNSIIVTLTEMGKKYLKREKIILNAKQMS
ncbi:MAG: hypothetical protein ACTSVY_10880 [Candidatus Helarchaeota archaeon]